LSCIRRARKQTRGDAPLSLPVRYSQAHARSAPGLSMPGTSTAATRGGLYLLQTLWRSTNSSQSQTRKHTNHRGAMVLLAASASVMGACSRVASSRRILSCVQRARKQTRGDTCTLSLQKSCVQALARSTPGACANVVKRPGFPQHPLVPCVLVVVGASAGAEDELPLDDLPLNVFLGQRLR
jgi:hypothetical protein